MKRMWKFITLIPVLLFSMMMAFAQPTENWKPVKDKATRLYGYQDKTTKEWVIAPQFDNAWKFSLGVAEVKVGKRRGLIDESGTLILPCEYRSIVIDKGDGLVHGCLMMRAGGKELCCDDVIDLWGLYGLDGSEIIPPFYESRLLFDRKGHAIARYAPTGLYGVISISGNIVVPFDFLALKKEFGSFVCLDRHFVCNRFDENGMYLGVESPVSPGYVEPYDAGGDDVKALVYRRMFIGERMHRNNIRGIANPLVSYVLGHGRLMFDSIRNVIDGEYVWWGDFHERFIRLFLQECGSDTPNAMYYEPTRTFYTVQAELCEPWGERVELLSEYGWFDGVCNEGLIYSAQGVQLWFLSSDVNMPARMPWFDITGYMKGCAPSISSAFSFRADDWETLGSWKACRDLDYEISLRENVGLQSYGRVAVPSGSVPRSVFSEYRILNEVFHEREVYGGQYKVPEDRSDPYFKVLSDPLFHLVDEYDEVGLENSADEPVYWGPDNARIICLEVLSADPSNKINSVAVDLCEPDGAFIRTLGVSNEIGFVNDDIIVLSDLGLAFSFRRPDDEGRIRCHSSSSVTNAR